MMEFHFWPTSYNWDSIIDLGAHWINKHARKLSQCSELLFWPPLSPTLATPDDGVSLLSSFLELKFDHRFGCPFHRRELLRHSKLFWPVLITTLPKPHYEVSFLTNFSELKFDCRFLVNRVHTNFHATQICFGHYSRLVKQRFKSCYFSGFLVIEIWKRI